MPVKEYRTRYVVFEVEDCRKLTSILNEVCNSQPGFFYKIVRRYDNTVIVKCPHKAVPIIKARVNELVSSQPSLGLKIIGVSGTLRKAVRKFCNSKTPLEQRL